MTNFVVPLRIEALALRAGWPGATVRRTGMKPARARAAAAALGDLSVPVVVGLCGALDPSLAPGDVVVATELRGPAGGSLASPGDRLAQWLHDAGLRVRRGPIASAERIVRGEQRRLLAATGAVAVDLESWWLADGRPLVVARAVVDTPERELLRPATLLAGPRALVSLIRMARALRVADGKEEELCPYP
jgi:4-hydroxy-3-methylbut-2-en-1-yl diphosphate reductase